MQSKNTLQFLRRAATYAFRFHVTRVSLIPRPLPFLFFGLRSYIQYHTQVPKQMNGKIGEGLGNTYHVIWIQSGGGAVPEYKFVHYKHKSEFVTAWSSSIMNVWFLPNNGAFHNKLLACYLNMDPSSPFPPYIHLMSCT